MKRKEKYNNNRGAALISVMIAVTFITIVASALLYMAYMNYTMKAVSVQSKRNFYETEGYLQGVTVKLQDNVANLSSGTTTYLATFKDGADNYDCKKLLALKYPSVAADASSTAASASIEIDGDTITLKRGSGAAYTVAPMNGDPTSKTQVHTFKGVTIVQETPEGLTNNIKTDIVYYVTEDSASADAGGVGEFSMMVDGKLYSSGGGFSFISLYGNNFISDTIEPGEALPDGSTNNTGKTIPGYGAINLTDNDKVNIAGKYCVVYGDIVLNDKSCLTVTNGNLCVYGDIILKGQSTLICSGKIYMVGEALTEYGRTNPTRIIAEDGNLNKHLYPAGLTTQNITIANFNSLASELKYNDNVSGNDGFLFQILEEHGKALTGDNELFPEDITNGCNTSTTKYGMTYGWQVFKDSVGNGSDFDNKLTFAIVPLTVRDTSVNSTILSKSDVTYDTQHGFSLKKIGPEAFKKLNLNSSDPNALNCSISVNVNGTNYNNLNVSAGDFFKDDCDIIVNRILGYAVNGEGGGTPIVLSSLKFENWVKDSE
ncbi:MAG: hypothetical protein K5644_00505 [Lachnospiraceae bacterium]|nr:hypothetical protein [Lachnospiraceae bacterium]